MVSPGGRHALTEDLAEEWMRERDPLAARFRRDEAATFQLGDDVSDTQPAQAVDREWLTHGEELERRSLDAVQGPDAHLDEIVQSIAQLELSRPPPQTLFTEQRS